MPKILLACLLLAFINLEIRVIEYNGQEVRTTFTTPSKFYGLYKGRKEGFLTLNSDGTGQYQYDVFGFAPKDCKADIIDIEWGFIVDENDSVVSFSREYGRSYPLLMKSTGTTQFQGCRTAVMLDFIMEYKDGSLGVSSSDDWKKN